MISSTEDSLSDLGKRLQAVNGELVQAKKVQDLELRVLKSGLADAIRTRDELFNKQKVCLEERDALTQEERKAYAALEVVKEADSRVREKISSIGSSLSHMKYDVQQMEALIEKGVCPTCQSPNPGETLGPVVEKLRSSIAQRQSVHDAFHIKLAVYKAAIEEKKQEHEKTNQKLRDLRARLDTIVGLLRESDLEVSRFKRDMQESRTRATELSSRRDEIKRTIESEEQRLKAHRANESRMEQLERVHEFLVSAFSTQGIRAQMLATITVPYLNGRIGVYSDILGMPFELATRIESKSGRYEDKVDVVLPGNRTYRSCSRGERRRIDLAIQCAINDLAIATGGSKVNLLVADEVIDPLDEVGVRAFIDVLQRKAQDGTVLLITHKPFLDAYAMERWTLVKEDGITALEVR
jgi:DNA repair exonuclease SbcCD ATPase subunit